MALIEQLGDGSWYVRFAARLYGTGMCHYAFILRFKERKLSSFFFCLFLFSFSFLQSRIVKLDGMVGDTTMSKRYVLF